MPSYISLHSLIKLPVVTQSGDTLGTLADLECDEEDFRVERLLVHPSGLGGLLKKDLIVHRTQVVEVTSKHIVVADTVISKTSPITAEPGTA